MQNQKIYTKKSTFEHQDVFFDSEENLSEDLTSEEVSCSNIKTSKNIARNMSNTPFNGRSATKIRELDSFTFLEWGVNKYESQRNILEFDLSETNSKGLDIEPLPMDTAFTWTKKVNVSKFNESHATSHNKVTKSSTKSSLKEDISLLLKEAIKKRSKSESQGLKWKFAQPWDIFAHSDNIQQEEDASPHFGGMVTVKDLEPCF